MGNVFPMTVGWHAVLINRRSSGGKHGHGTSVQFLLRQAQFVVPHANDTTKHIFMKAETFLLFHFVTTRGGEGH